jgi:hypothetical protein
MSQEGLKLSGRRGLPICTDCGGGEGDTAALLDAGRESGLAENRTMIMSCKQLAGQTAT